MPRDYRGDAGLEPVWRRTRWQRGALENIGAYGLTRATLRYWLQQIGIGDGTLALNAYFLLLLVTLLQRTASASLWFWVAVGMIFVTERLVTAWPAGWRARLLAPPLVIEIAYDLVLQAVYLKSLFDIATGRTQAGTTSPGTIPARRSMTTSRESCSRPTC